jgi:hypothetical protein
VKRAITHWTALCTHRITGKSVHEESDKPLVKMVQWIQYWQNRKVGRVGRRSHEFWPRQEMLRTLHGIRIGWLRKGSTAETMFEGLDIGTSTQDFESLLGIEPCGCTLSGLTLVQRAELEDQQEKWSEDLRLRKPVDGESSEEEDDDDSCGGGAGDGAKEKAVKTAAERQAEAVAGAQRKARQRRDCNAQVRHLMDEFGSEQALFYSTDGGYKLKQKKNDAGKVVEEQEFVGYGLAQWEVVRWECSRLGGRAESRARIPVQGVAEDLLTWQELYT